MTVAELIEALGQYPPEMGVAVDDVGNGCALPPQLVQVGGVLLIMTPSDVGDMSAGDRIATTLMEMHEWPER